VYRKNGEAYKRECGGRCNQKVGRKKPMGGHSKPGGGVGSARQSDVPPLDPSPRGGVGLGRNERQWNRLKKTVRRGKPVRETGGEKVSACVPYNKDTKKHRCWRIQKRDSQNKKRKKR